MRLESIKRVLSTWVLLEAIEEETSAGGIIIPIEARERFPQLGFVIGVGTKCVERIYPGAFAIIPNEGTEIGNSFYPTCVLDLKDWPTRETFDAETWPIFREGIESYRRSGNDKKFSGKTLEGDVLHFLASDVLDYGIEDLTNKGLKLDHVPGVRFFIEKDGFSRLFYFIREDEILATLEWEDG
jgi:hypothetical protein